MIGRKKEIKELNRLCEDKESRLAVIYGRRRIGKTYLVDYQYLEFLLLDMFYPLY